mgnify:CR=1 FL=1
MGKNKVARILEQAQAQRLERIKALKAKGMTLEAIGASEGITKSRVSQLLQKVAA